MRSGNTCASTESTAKNRPAINPMPYAAARRMPRCAPTECADAGVPSPHSVKEHRIAGALHGLLTRQWCHLGSSVARKKLVGSLRTAAVRWSRAGEAEKQNQEAIDNLNSQIKDLKDMMSNMKQETQR